MKTTICTNAGRIIIEDAPISGVLVKVKPNIWPEVMITLEPHEAALIASALLRTAEVVDAS